MKRFLPLCLVAAVALWAGNAHAAGWVAVGLPLDNDNLTDAESVGQDIPYCTDVSRWLPAQSWEQHTVGLPPNNFACSVTMALMAYVTQDSVWTLTGGVTWSDSPNGGGVTGKRKRRSGSPARRCKHAGRVFAVCSVSCPAANP